MTWRALSRPCVSTRLARSDILRSCKPRRYTSTLPGATPTIASILALPPIDNRQTPRRIVVSGHIRTIRNQKRHSFVEVGDGSTIHSLQAILDPTQATSLGTGTAVVISGLWCPCPAGKEQSHELQAEDVRIVGATDAEKYPLQKKYHSPEYLRTIPHLRLRTPFNALLARLRSDCDFHLSNFFRTKQFVRLQPPVITSSDCEGAGQVFTLAPKQNGDAGKKNIDTLKGAKEEFFRSPKFLTVSSQLHLEAFVHEHQRVWTLSPTFRAEKSDTPRHLSEFYMLEAEIRTETLKDVMDLVEDMIRDLAVRVQNSKVGKELLDINHSTGPENDRREIRSRSYVIERRWQGLKRSYWPRITYSDAITLLRAAADTGDAKFQYPPDWGSGLQLEHEKFLAAEIGQGSPIFVTDYPTAVKPFYMLPSSSSSENSKNDPSTVACFDLLLPEVCEIVGGSLREHRLGPLLHNMHLHGMRTSTQEETSSNDHQDPPIVPEEDNLEWYADLRRYGSVPHGGFGLGFDRLLGYLAGVNSVRDVAPWPRYYRKCDC